MKGPSARAELWRRGIIAPWYLYDYQLPVYQFLRSTIDPFFEATRRFGKTTTELVIDIEDCQRNPEWIVRWCEPWKDQARTIVIPEMATITQSCPGALKPRFYRTDSFFEFPSTGSRIYLLGVNEDRGESARGSKANKIVRDEYGSWVDPVYISNEVLRPQLLTTRGQMPTMSTPPRDLGHAYFTVDKPKAIEEKRFIARDFDTVESLSPDEKERFIASMGGRRSTAVRRELYLEPVSDPEKLVIPEYQEEIHDLPDEAAKPEFFDLYAGFDLGLNDHTAGLFAYVDFKSRTLVIEDEYFAAGKNTGEIVAACRAIEKERFGALPCRCDLSFLPQPGPKYCTHHGLQPYARWGDNEAQQLYDMASMHDYLVSATRKDDRLAAINDLRLSFTQGRIKIKKRCVNLRYQLKVGLWNERKTEFQRGEKVGHLDAVAALIYLHRNISWSHNPYPRYAANVTPYTHFIPTTDSKGGQEDKAMAEIFEPFAGEFGEPERRQY